MAYRLTAEFLVACNKLGIWFSIENPGRSLMWLTPWMKELLVLPSV